MTRHIYSTVQGPPEPRLRSYGSRSERLQAWLWQHPRLHFLGAVAVTSALVWAFLWCAFKVNP